MKEAQNEQEAGALRTPPVHPLSTEIDTAWGRRDFTQALALLTDYGEFFVKSCRRQFRTPNNRWVDEDAEDAWDEGMAKLVERMERPVEVTRVCSWVWTCAEHVAYARLRELNGTRAFNTGGEGDRYEDSDDRSGDVPGEVDHRRWRPDVATFLVEELAGSEVELRNGQITTLLTAAMRRLPRSQARAIQQVLVDGPETQDLVMAEHAGMSYSNFRSAKSRAYSGLRTVVPEVAKEMGINLQTLLHGGADLAAPLLDLEDDPDIDAP